MPNETGNDRKTKRKEWAAFRADLGPKVREWHASLPYDKAIERIYAELDKSPVEETDEDINLLWLKIEGPATLGDRIRIIRKHYGLRQTDFADVLKVRQASVSRWEKDRAEPPEDVIEKISGMAMCTPGLIRYGKREPTSTGELVQEIPIVVSYVVGPGGDIEEIPEKERYVSVSRPREGRPYNDVVAAFISNDGAFSVFSHRWCVFWRSGLRLDPALCMGQLCVAKVSDKSSSWLSLCRVVAKDGPELMLQRPDGLVQSGVALWVSPVLSLRQGLDDEDMWADEPIVPDDEGGDPT